MPFIIQKECPCCRDNLHHCKKCWDTFHNGKKHKDYIEPSYYGESMIEEELIKKFEKEHGIRIPAVSIKSNKERKYKEGEYH